jgi:hypothetical protein
MAHPLENHVRATEGYQVQSAQVKQPKWGDSKQSVEVLETSLYTFREVQISLARYKGKIIPPTTLRRWIVQMGIEPDEFGCYSQDDLTVLARLTFWLKRGKTVQSFAQIIQKELTTHGNQHCKTQRNC